MFRGVIRLLTVIFLCYDKNLNIFIYLFVGYCLVSKGGSLTDKFNSTKTIFHKILIIKDN